MKKYKYVVVSGCSFSASDDPELPNPGELYGDLIADYFGAKSYNLAKCGGTIDYVNRTILEWCGKNKDRVEDTLVILGMPSIGRWTLWSNKKKQWVNFNFNFKNSLLTIWSKGNDIKEYFYSYNKKDMMKYFKNSWNKNEKLRSAINIIVGLQSFFKVNNIDHVFFDASASSYSEYWKECDEKSFGEQYSNKLLWDSLIETEYWYEHPKYKGFIGLTRNNLDMRISEDDLHPNKEAHNYWAECLLEFINE
ncbi:MAG TPA: hypothetical protein EYQ51_05170 [Alphaproteobacteria bacterium]|jgi:hypothetical protein|nr:hypothetical protein [Alphaproteobacteria bacterium]